MANNKEEAGKGTPRPGEMPSRRTYATIDLTASEVEARTGLPTGASTGTSTGPSVGPSTGPSTGPSATPASSPSQATAQGKPAAPAAKGAVTDAGAARSGDARAGRASGAPMAMAGRVLATSWLPHLASGALGALVVLIAAQLAPPQSPAARGQMGDLAQRVSDLETQLGTQAGAGLRGRIEDLGRSLAGLGEMHSRLAREAKALETKLGSTPEPPPDLTRRLAKLEETLLAAATSDPTVQSAQVAALAGRLAELDKSQRSAGEQTKANGARLEGELSRLETEAGRLAQRLDALKGEIEERLKGAAKAADLGTLTGSVATLAREVETLRTSEADRTASANANATRMLLALELANLKRAIDRGEAFAAELARAKKLGGSSMNLTALERYMHEGAPAPQELAKSFRKVADAMLEAEAVTPDATLMDRLLSGARSIVRVRKATHGADDTSLEAIISRLEAGAREGRLADVLADAKKLPPKAALAAEDWIRKVEARQAIDRAMTEVETQLKASLAGPRSTAPEGKR